MDEALRMTVPLHFVGEEKAAGVKAGGIVLHARSDLEIQCLPSNLPEFIEVNVSALEVGQAIHLSELALPEGVTLTEAVSDEHDPLVVSIEFVKGAAAAEEEGAEEGAAAAGAASPSED